MSDSPLELEAQLSVDEMKRRILTREKRESLKLEHEAESLKLSDQIADTRPAPAVKPVGFFEDRPDANGEIDEDGWANDTWEVLSTGTEQFVENGAKFFRDLGDTMNGNPMGSALNFRVATNPADEAKLGGAAELGRGFKVPFTDTRIDLYSGSEWEQFTDTILAEQGIDVDATSRSLMNLPDLDRPDSAAGQAGADMTRFILTTLVMRRFGLKPGVNAGTAQTIAVNTAVAGLASTIIADPVGENMINVLDQHFPQYTPDVLNFLKSDENDPAMLNRLKTGLADAGMGLLIEPFVGIIGAMKRAIKSPTTRVADEAVDSQLDEIIPDKQADEALDANLPAVVDELAPKANVPATEDAFGIPLDNTPPPMSHLERAGEYTRALVGKVRQNPQLAARALEAIKSGNLHEADELIGMNIEKYNLEDIADEIAADPNKILDVVNTIAKEFEGIIGDATGGVQTNKMTEKLAYMMDGNVADVVRVFDDMRSGGGMAARMYAASIVARSQLKKAFELAEVAAKPGATEVEDAAAFEAIQLYGLITSMIKGAGTEAGRQLQMMSRVKQALSSNVGDMDDVLTALSGGKEARKNFYAKFSKGRSMRNASHLANRGKWHQIRDVVLEVYINGLLSGISTLVLNVASFALIKFPEDVLARYGAVAVGSTRNVVRQALGRQAADRVAFREANASMMGYVAGAKVALNIPLRTLAAEVKKKGWKQALADDEAEIASRIGTVYKTALDGRARTDSTHQRVDVFDVGAIQHGDGKVFRSGFFDELKDKPVATMYGTMINVLGNTIRAPGRAILTIDEGAKAASYHAELYAQAYRTAAREADVKGLKGDRLSSFMKKRQKEIVDNPSRDGKEAAIQHARQMTFQEELVPGTAARWLESGINRYPTTKFVVPFYRTPINIMKQTLLERTPLALFRKEQNNLLRQIMKGGPQADTAIMKVTFGGLAIGWAIEQALSGRLTTNAKSNAGRRNTEDQLGVPEYSYIFDDGTSIQIARADPYGMIMAMAAEMAVGIQNYDPDDPSFGQTLMDMSTMALAATTSNMLDKTWFKGFSDLVQALQEPERRAGYFLTEVSTNALTPYSSMLRRFGLVNDEFNREAWTWWDDYRKDIPWNDRKQMVIKRDYLGFPAKPPQYFGSAAWSPVMAGEVTDDPVKREIARLAFDYQMPRKNLWGFGELSPEQYNRFLELRGQTRMGGRPSLHEYLGRLMESGRYNSDVTSDLGREKMVKEALEMYDQRARKHLLHIDYPELNDKLRAHKRAAKLELFNLPQ